MIERRNPSAFTERLSTRLVYIAAIGAFIVLLDLRVEFTLFDALVKIGGTEGFSADLKGAVIASILVSGFAAVKEYWLGSSHGSEDKSQSISRIAEASAPVAAAAVQAANNPNSPIQTGPIKADEVIIDAVNATVNEVPQPPKGPTP